MLRQFAAESHCDGDDWLAWIKRSTHEAERAADAARCKCWTIRYASAKWIWAGHVARMGSYRPESWMYIVTHCRDSSWH